MNAPNHALSAILIALLALLASGLLPAQESPANLSEAWYVTVKPGHQAAFETAFKEHARVRNDHGDPRSWDVFTPITGENLYVYGIRTCCFSWPDQDAYDQWNRDNAAVMEHWSSEVDPHVEHYGHYFYETDSANSHWTDNGEPVRLVGVTEFYPAPGHSADFTAARTELSQVAIEQGWTEGGHRWAWLNRIGGKPVTILAVAYSNYAAMNPQDPSFYEFLSDHLGADRANALMKQLSGSTRGSKYSIWAHRADLTAAE
ncbi:hypothetical protein [Elongatibacter sediminis]|uniref:NIPSNAP domain-containing protein n=1 Tax=Elongatibacter sediminis TaxID=3119006 RepID=A0AAW9R930_9GAMM